MKENVDSTFLDTFRLCSSSLDLVRPWPFISILTVLVASSFLGCLPSENALNPTLTLGSKVSHNSSLILLPITVTTASPTNNPTIGLINQGYIGNPTNYCVLENMAPNNLSVSDCAWQPLPLPSSYKLNTDIGPHILSFFLKDGSGNVSNRVDTLSIIFDSTTPEHPLSVITIPPSPSNSSTPIIQGKLGSDTALISLYSDAACSQLLGTGTAAQFVSPGITISVPTNSTTSVYAITTSATGNTSSCTFLTFYMQSPSNRSPLTLHFLTSAPLSPSWSITPRMMGLASSDIVNVTFFQDSSCEIPIGTGTAAAFTGPGIPVTIAPNRPTVIYAIGYNADQIPSHCALMTSFLNDSIPPTAIAAVTNATIYNSTTTSPTVTWTASSDAASGVAKYEYSVGTSAGSTNVLTWTSNNLSTRATVSGLSLTHGQTYFLNVRAVDQAGNISAVTSGLGWLVDITPPIPLSFLSTNPVSPSNSSLTPFIIGSSSSNTTLVKLYSDPGCSHILASATPNVFSSTGIKITVSPNSTTPIFGQATSTSGNLSACTLLTNYQHNNIPPTLEGIQITNSNLADTTQFALAWGSMTGAPSSYCILENSVVSSSCIWNSLGSIPTSFKVTSSNGAKVLSVWVKDAAGNISTRVDSNSVTLNRDQLDRVGPRPSGLSPSLPLHAHRPILASLVITNHSPSPTQTYNLVWGSMSGSPAVSYCLLENDTAVSNCIWNSMGNLPSTFTVSAASGGKVISAWIMDATGNVSQRVDSNSVDLIAIGILKLNNSIVTLPVEVPTWQTPNVRCSSSTAPRGITPVISFDANATSSAGIAYYQYAIGTSNSEPAQLNNILSWTLVEKSPFVSYGNFSINTPYYVNMRVVDRAGGTTLASSGPSFTDIPRLAGSPSLSWLMISSPTPTRTATVDLSWGGTQGAPVSYCLLQNNQNPSECTTWSPISPLPSTYTFTGPDGSYTLSAWVKDAIGNMSSTVVNSNSVFLVTNPPAQATPHMGDTVIADRSSSAMTTSSGSPSIQSAEGPTLASLTITTASPTKSRIINLAWGSTQGAPASFCLLQDNPHISGCNIWSPISDLPDTFTLAGEDGLHILSAWLKDTSGNVSQTTVSSNSITLSTISPTWTDSDLIYDATTSSKNSSPPIYYNASAFSPVGIVGYQYAIGTSNSIADHMNDIVNWTAAGGSPFFGFGNFKADSTYYINMRALDYAGNAATAVSSTSFTYVPANPNLAANPNLGTTPLPPPNPPRYSKYSQYPKPNLINEDNLINLSHPTSTQTIHDSSAMQSSPSPLAITSDTAAPQALARLAIGGSDTVPPTPPAGLTVSSHIYNDPGTFPAFSWTGGGTDFGSGLNHFEYSIGTDIGTTDMINWTSNGTSLIVNSAPLSPHPKLAIGTYFINVRAVDNAGNASSSSSVSWALTQTTSSTPLTFTQPLDSFVVLTYSRLYSGSCDSLYNNQMINITYGAGVIGPANAPCNMNNTFSFIANYSGSEGIRTIKISQPGNAVVGAVVKTVFFEGSLGASGAGFNSVSPVVPMALAAAADGSGDIYAGTASTTYGMSTINYIARLTQAGALNPTFSTGSGFNGQVNTILPILGGKVYVGGSFTTYQGIIRNYLVRLNPDGSLDHSFNVGSGFNSPVYQITAAPDGSGDIYVGGNFTAYNGNVAYNASADQVKYLVRLTPSGGINTNFHLGTGLNGPVYSITVKPGSHSIYVGGAFTHYQNAAHNGILLLRGDTSTGEAGNVDLRGGGFLAAVNGTVYAILIAPDDNNSLYLGGDFTTVTGTNGSFAAGYIARLSASGIVNAAFTREDQFDATVYSMIPTMDGSNDIIVGGSFTIYRRIPSQSIARLTGSGALNTTTTNGFSHLGNGFNGAVYALLNAPSSNAADAKFYAAGTFTKLNGFEVDYFTRLHANGSLDSAFNTGSNHGIAGTNHAVRAVAFSTLHNDQVYLGGSFTSYAGIPSNYVARIHPDGTLDNSFAVGTKLNGEVSVVAPVQISSGEYLYIGGSFTSFNGSNQNFIARLTSAGSLDHHFSIGTGFDSAISTIVPLADGSGKIYVGGSFLSYQGIPASHIIRLNPDGSRDSSFDVGKGFNRSVNAVALANDGTGDVFVGGAFSALNGQSNINYFTRLKPDGQINSSYNTGTGFNGAVTGFSLSSYFPGKLYVSGAFGSYNGSSAISVIRLNMDGTQDASFGPPSGIQITYNNSAGYGYAVAEASDGTGKVYVGGQYLNYVNGIPLTMWGLVRLNSNGTLDSSFETGSGTGSTSPTYGYRVFTIYPIPDGSSDILVAGLFPTFNGKARSNIVRLNSVGYSN